MKRYAILGSNITHTLSPKLHMIFSKIYNFKNFEYSSFDTAPEDLSEFINYASENLCGFNVTIPYKEKIIDFLDQISDEARLIGSVNTVKIINKKLYGYNSDIYGFEKSLEYNNILSYKSAVLFGTGGAAKTIAHSILNSGCNLYVSSRTEQSFNQFRSHLSKNFNCSAVHKFDQNKNLSYDLLINTTPLGMYPHTDECPVQNKTIKNCLYVYDIIYNPEKTMLLKAAESYNKKILNGLDMLIFQAIRSEEIWQEINPKTAINNMTLIKEGLKL